MMNDVTQCSAPSAVEPFYATTRINQPVALFRGRVDIVGRGTTERYRGGVVLDWLPSPTIRSWVYGEASQLAIDAAMDTPDVEIVPRTPPRSVPRQARTTRAGPRRGAQTTFEADRLLTGVECGNPAAALSHGVLHLANFPLLHGRPVAWPDGGVGPGRLLLEGGGWTVVLDRVQGARQLHDALRAIGGFAFTHAARVERTSGGTFTTGELAAVVEALTWFCWLCAEARCGPMLPVGFDQRGRAAWSRWSPTRTESFPTARTWLDTVHAGEAEALFPTFMQRYEDPYWRQVIIHAIDYLIEAGRPSTLERAILLAQVLLEAVSYSWLVVERSRLSHARFRRHHAAQNIRLMLEDMGVPVAMPTALPALAAVRDGAGHRLDGPQALVHQRNAIVHRRAPVRTTDYAPLIDAQRLGAWYAELAVLRICGFTGLYRSRLSDNVWVGAVEPVPWSSEPVPLE